VAVVGILAPNQNFPVYDGRRSVMAWLGSGLVAHGKI
jgi:hypothetical protein